MNFLLLGLSLEGMILGIDFEKRTILHEFTLERRSYETQAFRTFDGWAYPVRSYTAENVSEFLFSWKAYAREGFDFLGMRCRYGVGGGLGFTISNSRVQLVDSSYINGFSGLDLYPSVAIFTQIFLNETNALRLVGSLDASRRFPFSGNLVLLFVIGL